MKHTSLSSLLLGAALLAVTHSSQAAIVVSNTNQSSAFTVSSTDLLQSAGVTHVNLDANGNVISDTNSLFAAADSGASAGVSVLTDGAFGPTGTNIEVAAGIRGQQAGANFLSITYTFDTSINSAGYDLESVAVYTGWGDPGRDDVEFNLLYSTVAAPNTFISLTSVNYTGGSTVPANNRSIVSSDASPYLATGVASIRFEFPVQENGFVGYRELDVIGSATAAIPEPSTSAVMLGLGALGLVAMSRRRKA